uniref:DUF7963 domain-containing protein n=1 Tax=Nelumbo nucifera TaxID=4432 RepID=A0A822Z9L2_NELNU|nr:TPA_asm: hypothetical protein HUJ06_015880 [Nelumbo nucifera]
MAAACHAQEDDMFSRSLQKRYHGLLTVRTRAIRGKGAWYWFHLEPILLQNQTTGTAKALKLRCGLCNALFSASNPSRTATEHLKRGTCPKFRNPETNSSAIFPKFRKHSLMALPEPPPPISMILAPSSIDPILSIPPNRPQLTQAQVDTAFRLLSDWFYESCGFISFSTPDHPKFRAFLHHLGLPQVNARYIFGRNLDTKYAEAKLEFEEKLQDAMFFQLSTNGWKKEYRRNNYADESTSVNVTLNLPNGSSLFHKVLFIGTCNPSSDHILELVQSTIKEISGGDMFRCAGIIADIGNVNCKALQDLELCHHWMVNLTCQSKAFHKLLKDFFKKLPIFISTASFCMKLANIFKSNNFTAIDLFLPHHQSGSSESMSTALSAIESVSTLSHLLSQTFTEEAIVKESLNREILDVIQDSKFWDDLNSVIVLIKLIKTAVQEIEEDKPHLGRYLPLWKELKSRIKDWCNSFNIEEKSVMDLVHRRFSKNYHQAWAASYVLDPLYLVEDSSGRYLPPFMFLSSEQEKDVVKIITRMTPEEDAHIALMELMKWRTQGLNTAYAQAVQAKERDPVTGKVKVVNPHGSRLVWETCLSEFNVLKKVAVRLIFLQATTGVSNRTESTLSWFCSKSRSKNIIGRSQKMLFLSSRRRLKRKEFKDEQGNDSEMFACKKEESLSE